MTTFADLKTRLNTKLRDSQNLTFTDDEKTEILTVAINDPYVYTLTRNASLTTAASTYAYALPTDVEEVFDLFLDTDGNGVGYHVSREDYDVIDGYIRARVTWPENTPIILFCKTKLDSASTDYPVKMQEYILELALVEAFELLKTSLTTRFLKNDMTMADIIQSIATHQRRAEELRRAIINQRLVTL